MTKAEVIRLIEKETGRDKELTSEVLESLFKTIKNNVIEGKSIYIRGFATFTVKKRAAKTGRDISKKIVVDIPEQYVPLFRASKEFKNRLSKKLSGK